MTRHVVSMWGFNERFMLPVIEPLAQKQAAVITADATRSSSRERPCPNRCVGICCVGAYNGTSQMGRNKDLRKTMAAAER